MKTPTDEEISSKRVVGSNLLLDIDDQEILNLVPENCGWGTAEIAHALPKKFGHNRRTNSGYVISKLLRLEKMGLVKRLDDEKPIAWTRTPNENLNLEYLREKGERVQ